MMIIDNVIRVVEVLDDGVEGGQRGGTRVLGTVRYPGYIGFMRLVGLRRGHRD